MHLVMGGQHPPLSHLATSVRSRLLCMLWGSLLPVLLQGGHLGSSAWGTALVQPLSNAHPTLVHSYTLQIPRQKTPLSPGKGIPIHFHQHLQRTPVQPHVSKRSMAVGQGGGTGMMGGGILPSPCLHSGGGVEAGWMAAGSAAHWGE